MTDGKICCPLHTDIIPSLHIYPDHFHCFSCGAHGNQIDWLMQVEGMDRADAVHILEHWDGPIAPIATRDPEVTRAFALRLWEEARPITGTLAARYLRKARGIDLASLPADIDGVLRFHARARSDRGLGIPVC